MGPSFDTSRSVHPEAIESTAEIAPIRQLDGLASPTLGVGKERAVEDLGVLSPGQNGALASIERVTGITIPAPQEIAAMATSALQELSRNIDITLLGALANAKIPRIGFHGGPAEAIDKLIRDRTSRDRLDRDTPLWVTVGRGANPFSQLTALYSAAARALSYAASESENHQVMPGKIAIFNLESLPLDFSSSSRITEGRLRVERQIPESSARHLIKTAEADSPEQKYIWGSLNGNKSGVSAQLDYKRPKGEDAIMEGGREARVVISPGNFSGLFKTTLERELFTKLDKAVGGEGYPEAGLSWDKRTLTSRLAVQTLVLSALNAAGVFEHSGASAGAAFRTTGEELVQGAKLNELGRS